MLPVALSRAAEADVDEAYHWYRNAAPDLSEAFMQDFLATAARIQENPLHYAVIHRDVRHALLKRFPYVVYYRLFPEQIRITAVPHGHRHPRQWQERH